MADVETFRRLSHTHQLCSHGFLLITLPSPSHLFIVKLLFDPSLSKFFCSKLVIISTIELRQWISEQAACLCSMHAININVYTFLIPVLGWILLLTPGTQWSYRLVLLYFCTLKATTKINKLTTFLNLCRCAFCLHLQHLRDKRRPLDITGSFCQGESDTRVQVPCLMTLFQGTQCVTHTFIRSSPFSKMLRFLAGEFNWRIPCSENDICMYT